MKALVLTSTDGPESASIQDVPRPEPATGEVRVALRAASLNHRELWISRGQYPGMKLPCIMGADGAGVVEAVGAGVDKQWLGREVVLYPAAHWGDRVDFPSRDFGGLGMPLPGTFAEFICVAATNLAIKPDHLSFEAAASMPVAGLTAWRALTYKARLVQDESVLVTGIGGGVATWALTFAKALGAKVYVTSSSAAKLEAALHLGADGIINYTEEKWGKSLAQQSGGIDVVIDGAPGTSFGQYARSLRSGARVVVYGSTGGANFQVSATDLFLRNIRLIGTNYGTADEFKAMVDFVAVHALQPVVDRQFALAEVREALRYLQDEHSIGKVVLTIGA